MPTDDSSFTREEVDAAVAFIGRVAGKLRAGLKEADQLARAGESVGYQSAFYVLRQAVSEALENPYGR